MTKPNDSETDQLLERARAVFPGGVLGSFALGEQEIVVERGSGARLYAVDGRTFVDCILASGPLILGHAHPAVVTAIAEQAGRGTSYYALNRPAIALAEEILSVFPRDSRLLFTSSGAEATFYALRLARAFTGRNLILKFAGAYHGHHDYAIVEPWARRWQPGAQIEMGSAGVPPAASETVLIAPFNDIEAVAEVFRAHPGQLAAVIIEPYQRVVAPEPGFLNALAKLAADNGALLVADEVVTGFRLTYGTAQDVYGFRADLTAFGKIIGGGLPLAAVAGRADILALADYRRNKTAEYVYVSGTLNGNAISAAAGLATLAELRKPDIYEQLGMAGRLIRQSLAAALGEAGFDVLAAGEGPMFHPVFRSSPPSNAAELADSDRDLARRFGRILIQKGVLVNPAQRSYLSTAHDHAALDAVRAAFVEAAHELSTVQALASA